MSTANAAVRSSSTVAHLRLLALVAALLPRKLERMVNRIQRIISAIEDTLLAVLLLGMIVLAVTQIALRNVADSGITWSAPALRVGVLWMALLGAMAATRRQKHIRIDVISHLLPLRARSLIQRVTDLFSAGICGIVAWHGARFVRGEWQGGGVAFGVVPTWIAQVIIPVGFAVIALRFLFSAAVQPPLEPNK